MQYFTQDFMDFFIELENNNSREWFHANKKRYEESVKIPFENFIQDMIFRIHEDDENLMITPKEAIFRIYRDIRFSKDKTPYKTHSSAVIVNGGRKNYTDPGVYIEMSSRGIKFYGGIYQMTKDQLQNVRESIVSNLDEFNALINDKDFKKKYGKVQGEQHKRIPKEFKEIHEVQPLIANKQFYFLGKIDSKRILNKNLADHLMKYYFAGKPLGCFLSEALGYR
ncbi:MAG: DUF2461 domain-containing protein [Ignavibacteriae bacterium]|nr:DUF2461 domain-containing protein [Ignavibacteriota bacterium]